MERPSGDAERIATEIGHIRSQIKRLRAQPQISQANLQELDELASRERELSRQLVNVMVERVTVHSASSAKPAQKTSPRSTASPAPKAVTAPNKKPGTQNMDKKLEIVVKVLHVHFAQHPAVKQLIERPTRIRPFVTFLRLGLQLSKFTDHELICNKIKKTPWLLQELKLLLDRLSGKPITEASVRQYCKSSTMSPRWKGERDDKAFEKEFCGEFLVSPSPSPPQPVFDYASDQSSVSSPPQQPQVNGADELLDWLSQEASEPQSELSESSPSTK